MRNVLPPICGGVGPVLNAALLLLLTGCEKKDEVPVTQQVIVVIDTVSVPPDAVADFDGNVYSTTVIGNQRWMAENLRSAHYADGDPIPYVPSSNQWVGLATGAWSNYDNDAAYETFYGKLYNWYAVSDARNVCPDGWHVPSEADWETLELALGMPVLELDDTGPRGVQANVGGQLKAEVLWDSPNTGADGSSGFSALPGGDRISNGSYSGVAQKGSWWSADEISVTQSRQRGMTYQVAGVYRTNSVKELGASIRCVKD